MDAEHRDVWVEATWEGARRSQLRAFRALSLRERLEALENLCDLVRYFHERRISRGQRVAPLFQDDPATVAARGSPARSAGR